MIGRIARQPNAVHKNPVFSLLVCATLVLPGCATMFAPDCARFKQDTKQTDYETHYRYSDYDTGAEQENYRALPRPTHAAARLYRMRLSDERMPTCSHIYIHKDLYLERNATRGMVLEQVREFYANGGQLIATKREDVTAQLTRSGYYSSTVPLPIPEAAPPGKYRIVSKLVLRTKRGARKEVLAQATTAFEVVSYP